MMTRRIAIIASLLLCTTIGAVSAQVTPPRAVSGAVDSMRRSLTALDSLYSARDSAGLAKALRQWKPGSGPRIKLYRGLSASLSGKPADAIRDLRPLLDSSRSILTPAEQRYAVRALAESYSRTGKFTEASALYDAELRSLDSALDSANAAATLAQAQVQQPEPLLQALTSSEPTPPPAPEKIPNQLGFIGLLFALFLIPKLLQRFRIPGAITALLMGTAATALGLFPEDPTLTLLSTLGITALFLFAGLDIDAQELSENVKPLVLHAAIWTALATITAVLAAVTLGVPPRTASLLALAIVTPSTGFILSSLSSFGLTPAEQKTVRTYAVGSELIALTALFFVLQSTSPGHLAFAMAAMAGVVIVIPLAFRGFAAAVAPYAPRSEFAFLLMVAVMCAYATRLLGVYYLVGAFLVGVAAQRYRSSHPAMSSEKMVDALESFGSVFIPFYFFHAGTEIAGEHITVRSIIIGLLLVATFVPIRVAVISLHRKLALKESFMLSRRVGSAMVPTLVFTLVIVSILEDKFGLSGEIGGALVLYTILNTTMPAFLLRGQPADFEDQEALPLEGTPAPG
jgi:Kef-type K+ transport system membrane component KefB